MTAKRTRINRLLQRILPAVEVAIRLSVVVTLGAMIGVYRGFTDSLCLFVRAASSVAAGEYHEISYPHCDEFHAVVETFNGMVSNMRPLQAQVVQVDCLSSVGQSVLGIAHEFDNPLVGVLEQAQLPLEHLLPGSLLRARVVRIERAARRCKQSVAGLLRFPRQHVYERAAEDVNRVLLNTVVMLDSEPKAHNVLVFHSPAGELPWVRSSVHPMQQVLFNLTTNAIQTMASRSDGNRLGMRAYLIWVPRDAGGPPCCVTVGFRDTGCGIPAENPVAIFEPMVTAEDKGRNRHGGIGLAVAPGVAAHHRGTLLVKSEGVGKGATFIISPTEGTPA